MVLKVLKKIYFGVILVFLSWVYFSIYLRMNSLYLMPREYKVVKKIVDKIAEKNYLGSENISFTINNGSYMSYQAKDLGVCKEEQCWYYSNLNPYKRYKNSRGIDLNELARQASLFNGIEAYAWKGHVWLSKSTFKSYGEKHGFLGCTIAHELSHILFDDHIKKSINVSGKLNNLKVLDNSDQQNNDEKKNIKLLVEREFDRESEKMADINGTKMMINSGYKKDTCLNGLRFLTKLEKLETSTKEDSTHPGYLERYESLEKFIQNYSDEENRRKFKSYKWDWQYDRKVNTLTFSPKNFRRE